MNRISASNWYATKNIPKSLHERKVKANPNPDSQNFHFQTVLAQSAKKADTITFSPSDAAPSALAPALDFEVALATTKTSIPEPNTSLRWHPSADALDKSTEVASAFFQEKRERIEGTYGILIGKNQLPVFFERLEKGLANGESFDEVIQTWWQVYNKNEEVFKNNMGDGVSVSNEGPMYDHFRIDLVTGEIKHAHPANNVIRGTDQHINAVWDLAYDLQQFIRYTFFKQEGDDPEETAKILAEIKERQNNKCTQRFDPVFRDDEYVVEMEAKLQEALAALGEDEFAEKAKDLIAEFLEAISKHQEKLYNEWLETQKKNDLQDIKARQNNKCTSRFIEMPDK